MFGKRFVTCSSVYGTSPTSAKSNGFAVCCKFAQPGTSRTAVAPMRRNLCEVLTCMAAGWFTALKTSRIEQADVVARTTRGDKVCEDFTNNAAKLESVAAETPRNLHL